jgi:hypothetical protein
MFRSMSYTKVEPDLPDPHTGGSVLVTEPLCPVAVNSSFEPTGEICIAHPPLSKSYSQGSPKIEGGLAKLPKSNVNCLRRGKVGQDS